MIVEEKRGVRVMKGSVARRGRVGGAVVSLQGCRHIPARSSVCGTCRSIVCKVPDPVSHVAAH